MHKALQHPPRGFHITPLAQVCCWLTWQHANQGQVHGISGWSEDLDLILVCSSVCSGFELRQIHLYKLAADTLQSLEDPHFVLRALACNSVHMRQAEMSSSSTAAARFSLTELNGKKFSGCKIRSQLQAKKFIWQVGRMKASLTSYSYWGLHGLCMV